MKTKVLSWIVTLALLLGMLPAFPMQTAQAADSNPWTNYAASSAPSTVVYRGQTCYAIGTAAQLAWFAKQVQNANAGDAILSANIVLTADINLNDHLWTPIYRHSGEAFSWVGFQTIYTGSIYGDYHTISNMRLGALAVNYKFTSNDSAHNNAVPGDIWHNEEYGFAITKGKIEGVRINGVSLTRSTAGQGNCGTHGQNSIVYDTYNAIIVYGDEAVTDIEIDNPQFTTNLNDEDILQLVGSSDKGATTGVYINGGTIASTGSGSTYLVESFYKNTFNTVVNTTYTTVEKTYSCVWGGDASNSHMSNNYTNIDLTQFASEELTGEGIAETKPSSWFTAANIQSALGDSWAVINGTLTFGADNWTHFASNTVPSTVTYNGKECYAIGTAEQLAWFAREVQAGYQLDKNIVLTADIDLSAHKWTPIYHHTGEEFSWVGFQTNYTGSIYGDYHTISGLKLGALSVDYRFTADYTAYKAKKGDVYHNDEYGFVITKGSVQGIRFNGINFSRAVGALGLMEAKAGKYGVIYDTYNALIVYGDASVTDIEIDNPQLTANLGEEDILQLVGSSDNGISSGIYINGGTITSTGTGSTYLVEAYYKTVKNTIVNTTFTSEEKNYSCVWGGDANSSTMEYNYTNVDISQFQSDELGEGNVNFSTWNAVKYRNALGSGWTVVNGTLTYGKWYTLTASAGAGGKASVTNTSGMFQANRTATVTITPNAGYEVDAVTARQGSTDVTVNGSGNTRTFTMPSGNTTASVTFKKINYSVTVNSATGGSVTASKTSNANVGDTITLTISASSGYQFSGVTVQQGGSNIAVSGDGNIRTFTMPAGNVTVTPTFVKVSKVNFQVPSGGTFKAFVDGSEIAGGALVAAGKTVTLTNTPNSGYTFDRYLVNNGSISVSDGQFVMPASDVTIKAEFSQANYTVTVGSLKNGTVTANKSTANFDDTVTLTIAPSEGYRLASLSVKQGNVNITVSGQGNTRTFTMPSGDVTISAEFELIPPTLKWEVELANAPEFYEGSDQIVVDVYVSGTDELSGAQFTALIPDGLTLVSITKSEDMNTMMINQSTGYCIWSSAIEGDVFDASSKAKVATITYSIKDSTATGNKLVGIASTANGSWEETDERVANDASSVYSINADVKNVKVTLATGQNGSIAQTGTFYAKYGTTKLYTDAARTGEVANWATSYTPNIGYQFANWNDGSGIWNAATAFTADKTLTAIFANGKFALTTSADNATVTYTAGVSNGEVTYLTPVTFTVTPEASYAVKSVNYTIGSGTAKILEAADGVYTIPGNALTGGVMVTVTTQPYYRISFAAGNTAFQPTTYYAARGSAGLHAVADCTDDDQVIAEPAANSGYRLDTDSNSVLKWRVEYVDSSLGSTEILTSKLGEYTFEGDATVTPKTVKTWVVTFTLSDTAHGGAISSGASQIIDDGKLPAIPTYAAFNSGYSVIGYRLSGSEALLDALAVRGAPVTEDTDYVVAIGAKTYFVSTMASPGATIVTELDGDEAVHGEALSFTVQVSESQLKSVSYAIGDGEAVVFDAANEGSYKTGEGTFTFTIPEGAITDYVTINAIIADQFSVTVTAGEGGKVNGKSSDSKSYSDGDDTGAQDFRIVAGAGRTIIAPDGVTLDSDGYIESISGLSEDTTYAFTFGYQTYSVSGDLTDEATYGTDFTWMPSVDGATVVSVSYRIGGGEQVNLDRPEDKNADGSYTIPGELILDDITVTYVVANSEWEFISKKQYGGLEKGTKIAILKADAPEEGAYFIDGEPMYVYNGSIGTYTNGTIGFMIIVDENETEESLTAKLNIVKEATNETLANSTDEDSGVVRGDFGGDGAVDLDDIGALNAILSGKKSSKITMKQRLSADVNGDGVVNLRDIMWLMEEMAGLPHS